MTLGERLDKMEVAQTKMEERVDVALISFKAEISYMREVIRIEKRRLKRLKK